MKTVRTCISMLLTTILLMLSSVANAQIINACSSEGPHAGAALTNGDAICVPNGTNSGSIQYYYILVPANTSTLYIRTAHGTGNGNLYYNGSTWATTSSNTHSSTNSGNTESINVNNPAQGYRYISVAGQQSGMTLLVSTSDPGGSSSGGSSSGGSSSGGSSSSSGGGLSNGQTVTGLSASQGNYTSTYYIDVPSGASNLTISASGGSGDADLYVRKGSEPTDISYDCRPYDNGNNETCGVGGDSLPTSQGRFYIKLKAYNTFSGVSLTASYTGGGSSSGGSSSGGSSSGGSSSGGSSSGGGLSNGQTVTGLSASQGNYTSTYYIDVPSGASNLTISTSGGSGDADLYVRKGSEPTDNSYDCRPYDNGNNETCGVGGDSLPTSQGRFYIKLKAYSTFSGVSLTASYTGGGSSSGGSSSGGSSSGGSSSGGNNDGYDHNFVHVLIFPFEFSDAPMTWTNAQIETAMQEVKTYFAEQSYGQFNVTWEIKPKMLVTGGTIVSYGADFFAWRDHYEQRITATGVNIDNPGTSTIIMVTAPQPGNFNSSGGPYLFTNYHHTAGVTAHEMGHALGLRHAMAINGGNSVISGSADESINYGNAASLMGAGGHTLEEINLAYKDYFGWLNSSNAPLITTSNTYRIYAFDHGTTTSTGAPGIIGLRIKSGTGEHTYYLEYRTTGRYADDFVNSGSTTTWTGSKNGVLFNLTGYMENETDLTFWKHKSHLLDMTPNSQSNATWYNNDQTDAALLIGRTYTDYWGGFRATVIGKGGTENTATAWIEVEITML